MNGKNKSVTTETTAAPKRHWVDVIHSPMIAWVILFMSLLVTLAAWQLSSSYAEERAGDRFSFQVEEAQLAIKKRMLEYEQMMRGGVGLFNSARDVSRSMWNEYVNTLEINRHYPGVQGLGFSRWINVAERQGHIDSVRAEGFSDYTIKPEGERQQYTTIVYLEPFDVRNQRAFGYDMYSNEIRREAMSRARDTGESALSGRVTLLQETNTDVQPGFLMYLPVYKRPVESLAQRRLELMGFVYSPFRIRDLMQGILGAGLPELDFEIYDGDAVATDQLLYDSTGNKNQQSQHQPHHLAKTEQLHIAGRTWSVYFTPNKVFESANEISQPLVIAVGGVVIDLLLFFIILSLTRLRHKAQQLAGEMVKQLGERELHFKAIADTANDAIVSTDKSGNITYFNKAAQNIFGYCTAEAVGKPIAILMPEQFRGRHNQKFSEFITDDGAELVAKTIELVGLRKDGTEFPLELSLASWQVGGTANVNAIIRDITERKKIDRMKSEFVSTVSHELRTPLTSIRGSLSLIANGVCGEVSSKASELLDVAIRNIERLNRLINDILDMEKIEFSQLRLNIDRHEVGTLLHQAVETNSSAADVMQVRLELGDFANQSVDVDIDRFMQIMTNLITNAIKFSPIGGRVLIETSNNEEMIRFAVSDQGPGIAEEFNDRIFGKFAQADSSDTRSKGGTGLGLSIAKALVEKMGGTIGFHSEAGIGTRFYFDQPVATGITLEGESNN